MFAGQSLNVIDPADGLSASAAATGNGLSVDAEAGDVSLRSTQAVNAEVTGQTDVTIHGWSPATTASSLAVGNAGDAVVRDGSLDAGVRQSVGYAGAVYAGTRVQAVPSSTMDTTASATAVGNTHGFYASDTAGIAAVQKNHGRANSRVDVELANVKGEANLAATTVANSLSTQGGSAAVETWQDRDGEGQTGAYVTADMGAGAIVAASARSTANSLSAVHSAPYLSVRADQVNENGVQAKTDLYVGLFGGVTSSADAVGNSIHAGVYGEELSLDTTQFNGGTVEASADFSGDNGYDVSLGATAFGNMVTGFACSDCDATLDARNDQVNHGGVSAVTSAWVGGGRTVNTSSTAVGNNATYYVTRPGQ